VASASGAPSGGGNGSAAGSGAGTGSNGGTATTTTILGVVPTAQTIVSVDPATGETTYGPAPGVASESGCVDPATGLPADASVCASLGPVAGEASASAAGGGPTTSVAPQYNPTVDRSSRGPTLTKTVWWLAQGAGVCAIGVALAGVRRRVL
jgi:hypothetical protein